MTEKPEIDPGSAKISIEYRFTLKDGIVKQFQLDLRPDTLRLVQKERPFYPPWTKLSFFKCPNCPLSEDQHPRCPIAANLVDLVEFFKDSISYELADVEITTAERTFKKRAPLQSAVSSLLGIYMVTSGCPVMDKLRPMVRTHLPFATGTETLYRAISMYLMAQYFLYKRGRTPDWDLNSLVKIYEEVRVVNRGFYRRIAATHIEDASLNALVHLDYFADLASFSLDHQKLAELEQMFEAYIESEPLVEHV